jgi:hypothetical protein
MRGIGLTKQDLPKWKERMLIPLKERFVRETDMPLLEQRQHLPIYRLTDELTTVNPFLELADILFSALNFVAN